MTNLRSKSVERIRLALLGSSANLVSTILNFLVFFISVPMTIGYLGEERFGLWMTISSIAGMLSFMDFGVGNGLVSQVAKSRVNTEQSTLSNTISRGLLVLVVIATCVGLLLIAVHEFFPLSNILHLTSDQALSDLEVLSVVFIVLFTINIPLNGLFKIMFGLQRSWLVHTLKSVGSILSIILVYTLAKQEAAPGYLLMSTYGIQVLMPCALLPYFFRQKLFRFDALSNWQSASHEYKNLISFGGLFLVLQLGMMVGWGMDALIISSLSSVAAVAQYAVIQKLFQIVSIPLSIINTPLWGAYADAHAHGDTEFIRKTLKLSLLITFLLSSFLSLVVYFGSDLFLSIWIDDQIAVSGTLLLGFSIWKVLQSVGNSISMALNGLHIVKIQVVAVLMMCSIVLPLKIVLTPVFGAAGVIWSTVVGYALSTLLFYAIVFRKDIVATISMKQTG